MRIVLFALMVAPVSAFAQAAGDAAPGVGSAYASLLPLVMIFVVFYFLLIKPQQKRLKEHQNTLGALKKGDKVVTGGGIIGKITKLGDADTITVEIAAGVEVTVVKSTVSGLVGAPVAAVAEKKKAGSNKNDNAVPSRDSIANDN